MDELLTQEQALALFKWHSDYWDQAACVLDLEYLVQTSPDDKKLKKLLEKAKIKLEEMKNQKP